MEVYKIFSCERSGACLNEGGLQLKLLLDGLTFNSAGSLGNLASLLPLLYLGLQLEQVYLLCGSSSQVLQSQDMCDLSQEV